MDTPFVVRGTMGNASTLTYDDSPTCSPRMTHGGGAVHFAGYPIARLHDAASAGVHSMDSTDTDRNARIDSGVKRGAYLRNRIVGDLSHKVLACDDAARRRRTQWLVSRFPSGTVASTSG
jgi:hypothetical protein